LVTKAWGNWLWSELVTPVCCVWPCIYKPNIVILALTEPWYHLQRFVLSVEILFGLDCTQYVVVVRCDWEKQN
jgi:hypothetical protein